MSTSNEQRLAPLLNWREELIAEMRALRVQQREVDKTIARKEAQLRNIKELLKSEGYQVTDDLPSDRTANGSITDTAWAVLNDLCRPAHYRSLAEGVQRRGVVIPGRDPAANLLSYLSRDGRFKRVNRGTYALSKWEIRSGDRPRSKKRGRRAKRQDQGTYQ